MIVRIFLYFSSNFVWASFFSSLRLTRTSMAPSKFKIPFSYIINYLEEINSKYSSRANTINVASDLIKKKLREGNYPLMSWKDSINNMKIINKWRDILRKA